MRFAFAHKLSTYLMAYASFFALILSGELGAIPVLLSFIGIVASWWWEPPRIDYQRYDRAWTIITVVVLLYSFLAFFAGGDFLLLAGEFLLYLTVAKLFNRRACKDYQHVYILTFLMLVAGTVLNTEFTYGLFFLLYVVAFTWAQILFHLRREMEDNFLLKHSDHHASQPVEVARILNSRRIVGSRFFIGTSLVSVVVFFAATLLFLMIPRIGFGLFFQKSRGGLTMSGFSDGVSLDGHGVIKYDTRIAMRVKVDSAYEGRKAPYIHWRGVAFDTYENGTWRRTRAAPPTRRVVNFIGRNERHHLLYDREDEPEQRAIATNVANAMHQEIYLEPLGGNSVLFGAAMPTAFEFESRVTLKHDSHRGRNDEIRHAHSAGIRYEVYSNLKPPPPEVLRAAPTNFLPEGYEVYLQLPDEITTRVRMKAREITRNAATNYDKAIAIEQWLKNNLDYTLTMVSPGDQEPIDFFLFTRKKGHCEYFSSAMVVLARAVGVPTRNVNGFLGGEWNEYDDYIAVRAGDAHSWVEAYFPGAGWVTLDPTPSAEVDRLGRGGTGWGARMRRFFDTLRFKWFKWVIEYDLYRQLAFFKKIGASMRGGSRSMKASLRSAGGWIKRHRFIGAAVVSGILLALVVWLGLRRRRDQEADPTGRRRSRRRRPIANIYLQLLRRLRKRGHHKPPATTPREHATTLVAASTPGAAEFAELTELYYAAEYGDGDDAATLHRAQELRQAIDQALREARR